MANINIRPRSRECKFDETVLISWQIFLVVSSVAPKMCDVWVLETFYIYSDPEQTITDAGEKLLLSSAHPLQEGNEGHEAILILRLTELLHQGLSLLLGQLLTEVGQETEKLVSDHGVVVIFVVQLQDLNKVVEATLVLGVLGSLVGGVALGLGKDLLSLLGLTADLSDGLQGGVKVASSDEIAEVEGIDLAISLEVIDIKSKVNCVNLSFL